MKVVQAWINPRCSKSRGLVALLEDAGIEARLRNYLEDAPSAEELQQALTALALDDPSEFVRQKDPLAQELELAGATSEQVVAALAAHPQLLQRPVLFVGERALIARPPERAHELLDASTEA